MNGLANCNLSFVFPSSPDVRAYYPATSHEDAVNNLQKEIGGGCPFSLLLGEAGMGKTLMVQVLLERLLGFSQTVFIPHGHFDSSLDILKAILFDLGLPHQGNSLPDLRLMVADSFLTNFSREGTTLVIQDEAHLLSTSVLEEFRLLGNLETGRKRAAQILFLAQPGMEFTLARPELISLEQRVSKHYLHPLDLVEAADYLLSHGRLAGYLQPIFSPQQLQWVLGMGKGVPRLLNHFSRTALQGRQGNQCDSKEKGLHSLVSNQHQQGVDSISEPEVRLLTKEDWKQSA